MHLSIASRGGDARTRERWRRRRDDVHAWFTSSRDSKTLESDDADADGCWARNPELSHLEGGATANSNDRLTTRRRASRIATQANQSYANELKDLTSKLSQTLDEKKKNEETLKQHAQELKQQLIIMKTKVERGEEIHKEKEEKLAAQETLHKGKIEEFKEHVNALKMELQDSNAKTVAEQKVVKQREAELQEQRNELMKLDAKNASLIAELDNTRAQCVQWQRDSELAKAEMKQAHAEAEAAKEERMKEEKHRGFAENETAESRRKAQDALALAAEEKEKRKLAEQALDQREHELKDIKHKAQMMEKDYKEMLSHEKAARAELEENYETLKQDSVNLYNAYTSCNQQIEEYRIALEREAQEAAALHAALAKQKEDAARDALRTRSTRVVPPPAGFLSGGSPGSYGNNNKSPNGNTRGVRFSDMEDIRSPPSFAD